jgi:Ca2+-transporting ATPase
VGPPDSGQENRNTLLMGIEQTTDPKPLSLRDSYAVDAEQMLDRLHVSQAQGLSSTEISRRQRQFGLNLLKESQPTSLWSIFYDQLRSLIIALLAAAAILSAAFGQWTESIAILVVIIINTAIGFFTELRAIRSMEALRRLSIVNAKVRRGGRVVEIQSKQLVPGDIVIVEAGDIISADLRLLTASKLQCDESILTGESMPVTKDTASVTRETLLSDRSNMAFQGTAITSGSGEGVVVATAMSTELGHIAALVEQAEETTTPLEKRLEYLSHQLVWITLVLAAVIGGVGILGGKPPLLMIETAIALAVAAVPEGLPMVATLALARGMWRMARRNALIERLPAVETLGATTVIMTDKTGTLTENRMTVTRMALPLGTVAVTATGFERDGVVLDPQAEPTLIEALDVGVLCNNASLSSETKESGDQRIVGDPMEGALLIAGGLAGRVRDSLLQDLPEIREDAFDTDLKMMATVHQQDGLYFVAVKGAPESVLGAASHFQLHGSDIALSESERAAWLAKATDLASTGLRVLGIGSKTIDSPTASTYENLTFLGLVGFHDPPRSDVPAAIETCKRAGIRVVMVTGDHAITAQQISRAVGLVDENSLPPCEGQDLGAVRSLSKDEQEKLRNISIFARVSPRQKLDIISLYQSAGDVVAMTGDGVNDAPALQQADIGVAMGLRGSQVAREAADIVLQDDAFGTIVAAIAQGRVIFSNIRKFILYLLSCNLSEIMVVGLASLSGMPLPILPLQILFLNLVTDVFPAFALGAGEGEKNIMDAPPRDPKEPLLPLRSWVTIATYGATITAATLTAFVIAIEILGLNPHAAVTISFLTLALAQLWHVFDMRDQGSHWLVNDVTRNRYVWAALLLCLGLILMAVYLPGVSDVLGLSAPSLEGWGLALGLSVVPVILGQIAKSFPVSRKSAATDGP